MSDVLAVLMFVFILLVTSLELVGMKDCFTKNEARLKQIEMKIDRNSEDIQQMKKELVILDSVCDKVLDNEW